MRKKELFILLLSLSFISVFSQSKISGSVKDKSGEPLYGVVVKVKGVNKAVITDLDGVYSIEANSNDILVFSIQGRESQEVKIGNQTSISISMGEDTQKLEDVVVSAFGMTREKKTLGYAVQDVGGDKLSAAGFQDVSKGLQGKIAGVSIKQSSGMPGASSNVTIRGTTSLTGSNQPLYVIDGVPVSSGSDFGELVSSGSNSSSRSLDINPDDIQSMDVLKGPAAAALYGLRASNGVIVITTKSGKGLKDGDMSVSVSSNYTYDVVARLPELQKTYAQGSGGNFDGRNSMSWGPKISEMGTYTNALGEQESASVYDNMDKFFKGGHNVNNGVSISKATSNGTYNIGVGSTNQTGIIPTTGMDRYNAKFNGLFNMSKDLKVGASVNYAHTKIDKIPGGSNLSNPLFTTYFAPVSYDLKNKPISDPNDPYRQIHYRAGMDNPYWSLKYNSAEEKTNRFFGNINLDYKIAEWASVKYRVGIDNYTTTQDDFLELGSGGTSGRPTSAAIAPSGGLVQTRLFTNNQFNSNLNFTFNKDLTDDLKGLLIVGNEVYDINTDANTMIGKGLINPSFKHISNTSTLETSRFLSRQRVIGFFGNLNLDYADMLFFNATGRYDIVSNMPSNNRGFFYPSVSLGFLFTNLEPIKELKDILSFGKLRASFAQVGQAGNEFSTVTLFNRGIHTNGFIPSFAFPFNGYGAATQSNIFMSDKLKPQNTNSYEFGLDLKFFDNRIGLDYTYYFSNSDDQIFSVPLPYASGYTSEYTNSGAIESYGHEIILKTNPVRTDVFNWNFDVNFTITRSKVTKLAEGVEQIQAGYQNFAAQGAFGRVGYLYPVIVGSKYKRDDNGNRIIGANGLPLIDSKTGVIKEVTPDFEVNFINSFNIFKDITIGFQLDWRQGGYMHSGTNALGMLYGITKETENRDNIIAEGVKEDGSKNDIAVTGEAYYRHLNAISEASVYETTFLRLRELTVSYEMPKEWFEGTFIKSLSLNLQGRNLWLWTKELPNIDPETSTSSGNATGAFEYVGLPNTRSFGGGFKLNF